MNDVRRAIRWITNLFVREPKQEPTRNGNLRKRRGFMNSPKITGTVKFFNNDKGFGFIRMGAEDIFVHATKIIDGSKLSDNDEVRFTVGEGRRGPEAQEVELVRKAETKQETRREDRRSRGSDARY